MAGRGSLGDQPLSHLLVGSRLHEVFGRTTPMRSVIVASRVWGRSACWGNRACFRSVALGGFLIVALAGTPSLFAVTLADSVDDWSASGLQGENGWFNGYYDLTTDTDGVYDPGDFIEFVNDPADPPAN